MVAVAGCALDAGASKACSHCSPACWLPRPTSLCTTTTLQFGFGGGATWVYDPATQTWRRQGSHAASSGSSSSSGATGAGAAGAAGAGAAAAAGGSGGAALVSAVLQSMTTMIVTAAIVVVLLKLFFAVRVCPSILRRFVRLLCWLAGCLRVALDGCQSPSRMQPCMPCHLHTLLVTSPRTTTNPARPLRQCPNSLPAGSAARPGAHPAPHAV